MSSKKIFVTFLMLFAFTYSSVNAACDFKNLNSCSIGDLMEIVNSLIVPEVGSTKNIDCPSVYLPVCGKDNVTYQNVCFLNEEEVRMDYLGACLEYPNSLRASECLRDGYDWSGYKCFDKNKDNSLYINSKTGVEFEYPSDSELISDNLIDLSKERKDTNLIAKRLEVISGDGCDNFKYYTNILSDTEENINDIKFDVIESEDSLEYGKNIFTDIKYKSYIYKENGKCINFLFSLISDPNSAYDEYTIVNIEPNVFSKIMSSVSLSQEEKKQSPCGFLGDLNEDGYLTNADIALLEYGTIQNNFQKRGDVNGDNLISDEDKLILDQYNSSLIDTFPACLEKKQIETKNGNTPSYIEISSNFDKNTNTADFVIEIYADNGDVLIPAFIDDSINFEILNNDIIDIIDAGLNTSASITEDGFILIKEGDSEWINANFELKANAKPVYSNVLLNGINYLDENGNISSYDLSSESKRIYLNYVKGQENLPPCEKYGDLNLDGYVTNDDIWAFRLNEYKKNADLDGDNEITIRDFLELKNYLDKKELFTVCKNKTVPLIYDNGIVTIEEDGNTKRVFLTFYADSKEGDSYIPSEVTFNQDDNKAGIYIDIERDGYLNISDLKIHTSANYTRDGLFKLKKDLPQWFRIEFDVNAIKDTTLADFKVNKIAYLDNDEEREYLYPEDIKTGDIFLNYEQKKINAPCGSLGDLDLDGYITENDYNYLKNNSNLLFKDPEKFILADVNKDGKNNEIDLKEINDLILSNIDNFSGCEINLCSSDIEITYTKDGYLYSNECYAMLDSKEVKCKIGANLTCESEKK